MLGHALYMKTIHGGKAKNDKIDSYKIASLLKGGNFPLAYTYPKEMRATRDLLRRRTGVVRHGASLKSHVVNTDSQYNLPAQLLNLKNISARESLRHHYDDDVVQRTTELDMVLLNFYAKELAKVEYFIEKQTKQHHGAYLYIIRSFPGIGQILGLTILYETGQINTFI